MRSSVLQRAHKFAVLAFVLTLTVLSYSQAFTKSQTLAGGAQPYGVKAADLNKDGKPDLIWFQGQHYLEIAMGKGDGTFSVGPVYDTLMSSPAELEVADMNHDGIPDIIVAGSNAVAVFTGWGDGTFRAPKVTKLFRVVPNDYINSLAVGDFNKDGNPDVLISFVGSSVQLLFGRGDGWFLVPATVFPIVTGQAAYNAEAGDFDGDGNLDIVFRACCDPAVAFGGRIFVWFGDGHGNFPDRRVVLEGAPSDSFVVFDINRDGKADIVGSYIACGDAPCPSGVFTLLYSGSRTFKYLEGSVGATTVVTGVAAADFDLNGVYDLAEGVRDLYGGDVDDGFMISRRNTDGTIQNAQLFSLGTVDSVKPSDIYSADFNGDRKPDLVLTLAQTDQVVVFLNTTVPPGCSAGALYTVHICTPGNLTTVPTPVHVIARANSDRTITAWKIYVDGVTKASGTGASIDKYLTLGTYSYLRRIMVKAWDSAGRSFSSTVSVMVK